MSCFGAVSEGRGADDIIIAVANRAVQTEAQQWLAKGGVLNLFGGLKKGEHIIDLDTLRVHYDEIRICGSSGGSPADIAETLRMIAAREFDVGRHMTMVGSLDQLPRALEMVRNTETDGKIVLYPHIRHTPLVQARNWTLGEEQSSCSAMHRKTFVGFGFGAIQGGLFLYEAYQSGNFDRLVVAEVVPEVVSSLRRSGGRYRVNIATRSGLEVREVTGVEAFNPNDPADRAALLPLLRKRRSWRRPCRAWSSMTTGRRRWRAFWRRGFRNVRRQASCTQRKTTTTPPRFWKARSEKAGRNSSSSIP